jgi:hypothetical protein
MSQPELMPASTVPAALPVAAPAPKRRTLPQVEHAAPAPASTTAAPAPVVKTRKASDPAARVIRTILRDHLTRCAQAMLYGQTAAADQWYAYAKQERARLDKHLAAAK